MEREKKSSVSRVPEIAWKKTMKYSGLTDERLIIFRQILSSLQADDDMMKSYNLKKGDINILARKMDNFNITYSEIAELFNINKHMVSFRLFKTYYKVLNMTKDAENGKGKV